MIGAGLSSLEYALGFWVLLVCGFTLYGWLVEAKIVAGDGFLIVLVLASWRFQAWCV